MSGLTSLALAALAASATAVPAQPLQSEFAAQHHEVLSAVSALALQQPHTGPQLASKFSAQLQMTFGLSNVGAEVGEIFYDKADSTWRIAACSNVTLFHKSGDEMCFDELHKDTKGATPYCINATMGKGALAGCRPEPYPYYDLFGALAVAKPNGTSSSGGVACDLWRADIEQAGANTTISACVSSDGLPREFNMTTGVAYKAAQFRSYILSNPTMDKLPKDCFKPTAACKAFPAPQCASGGVKKFKAYRVHSKAEPNELGNRNAGDALGDMAFFCNIGMDSTQLVTEWDVEADSAWSQYSFCLYLSGKNVCMGNVSKQIGRESAMGVSGTAVQGQCDVNADVGNWFSFPVEGQCPDGQPIGTNNCAWTAKPVRSVVAGCIIKDRGLGQSCDQERGFAPMLKSRDIFAAALASSDPAHGGCPDAPGGSFSPEGDLLVV